MAAYFDDEPQGWELADWEFDNDDFYYDNGYEDDNFWDNYCYKGGDICVCENRAECKLRRIHGYDYFDNDDPHYGQIDGIPWNEHCYKGEPIEVKDVCEPKISPGHSGFNKILFEGK